MEIRMVCSVETCAKTNFHDSRTLMKHLNSHIRAGQKVACPFIGCSKSYRIVSSFSSHVARCHRQISGGSAISTVLRASCSLNSQYGDSVTSSVQRANAELHCVESLDHNRLFWMKLEYMHMVPSRVIDDIMTGCQDLVSSNMKEFYSKVVEVLKEQGADASNVAGVLTDDLLQDFIMNGVIESKYQRTQYYKNLWSFVPPLELKCNPPESIYHGNDSSYCYVSIIKTLKVLFKTGVLRMTFCNPQPQSPDGCYCDIKDGAILKNNNFFSSANVLQIILYQDSFEIVNPLGSAKKKHKILAMYFTIGNIYKEHRSKIDSIQLVMLCNENEAMSGCMSHIFSPLINDLKCLEAEGIDVGLGENVKGSVLCILGDNLGSNWLGGFVTSFSSATYVCRFCTARRDEFLAKGTERPPLRTISDYDRCAEDAVRQNNNVFGVKKPSIFNTLQHFHICNPGLPPCLAHDLFEGAASRDVILILNYFVSREWFTFEYLNHQIQYFPYSKQDSSSKPALLKVGASKLNGNASQNWCFMRLFPLLIRHKILDYDDDVWSMVLLLRSMIGLICAPRITSREICVLSGLIDEYTGLLCSIFPGASVLPKHHIITHYPYLITQYGPLINLWTLRFESKHSYFKEHARKMKNFRNVAKTLATGHQMRQAYLMQRQTHLIVDFSQAMLVSQEINSLCDEGSYFAKVIFKGTEYRAGQFLVMNCDFTTLKVGFVLSIIKKEEIPLVVVEVHQAEYDFSLGVYKVQSLYTPAVKLSLEDIMDYMPLTAYHLDGVNYLVPKHYLSHD